MATWEDVERVAAELPELHAVGSREWRVRKKLVAWERPLRKADLAWLGDSVPDGPILGVRTPDLAFKEALIADNPDVYFTTPHFDGYPSVLMKLDAASVEDLEEVILEGWATQAPKRVVRPYLEARGLTDE